MDVRPIRIHREKAQLPLHDSPKQDLASIWRAECDEVHPPG